MRTRRKMAALLLVMIGLTLICTKPTNADSVWFWDWDTCTDEGWMAAQDTIIMTAGVPGQEGCGISVEQTGGHAPSIKIGGQTLDPGALVGGEFGNALPMTGEIYVDINRQIPTAPGSYVEMQIFDEDSFANFACYPYDGYGSIIDLGDGWYRHYMGNVDHWEVSVPEDAGYFYLSWNCDDTIGGNPVTFDNLMVTHEPVPIEVGVDIRPALCPNPLSIVSKGVLPVAIVGTNELDVYDIEPTSVSIVIGEVEISAIRHSYKDIATTAEPCVCPSSFGPNGFNDLLLDFRTEDILEALGSVAPDDVVELDFSGRLADLTPIFGSDCVLIRDAME